MWNFAVNILNHVIIAVFEKDFDSFLEKIKQHYAHYNVSRLSFADLTLRIQMRGLYSEHIDRWEKFEDPFWMFSFFLFFFLIIHLYYTIVYYW